ncbi:hypothetical protein POM88_006566 [Heracleum sosnowskyi]|uniref:Transposase-associated domain-containing protein n=1 Tax=Heracleum sosnowskyi TaxID=360622 RepID=A0AAD8J533_9APIA|nr:hypothetical protein POM88_006566 [Heracleum sosnowskyi]
MDRHTWMYKISRATQDCVDGVEKFIECAEGNLKKKREQGNEDKITCPCHDCYNLKKYPSVATVRDHLFRRGFMADYTKWIWHGEGIHYEKSKTSDGNRGSIGESMPTNKEDDAENDRMNEMIEDVEELLVHQPKMLENLVDDSKKLLYPGCNDQFTSKVIDPMTLDKLQADIIVTLCEFEIFLCILKAYMRNRRLPEASIVEGYSVEETIEFCTEYLTSANPVGIPRSRHEGRLEGQGTLGRKMISPTVEMLDRAHLFVLQHMTEVNPYLQEHITEIRRMHHSKSGKWVTNEHNRSFVKWFKDRVMSRYSESPSTISNTLKWLAYGPDMPVISYQGYDVNGWSIVLQSKRRILGIDNVEDEEEYNQFDENPPFSIGLPTTVREDNVDGNYARSDHDEGQWIDHQV